MRVSGNLRQPPLWCRFEGSTLWLVGSAASPVGQDQVRVDLHLGEGVDVEVRSVAAMIAYTGRKGGTRVDLNAEVGPGANLWWRPEPLIITRAARHATANTVRIHGNGSACIDEIAVFGRTDEAPGSASNAVEVWMDGTQRLLTSWDTATPGFFGPGGMGRNKVLATRLFAGPHASTARSADSGGHSGAKNDRSDCAPEDQGRSGLLRLDSGGALVTAVAPGVESARALLEQALPSKPTNHRGAAADESTLSRRDRPRVAPGAGHPH